MVREPDRALVDARRPDLVVQRVCLALAQVDLGPLLEDLQEG